MYKLYSRPIPLICRQCRARYSSSEHSSSAAKASNATLPAPAPPRLEEKSTEGEGKIPYYRSNASLDNAAEVQRRIQRLGGSKATQQLFDRGSQSLRIENVRGVPEFFRLRRHTIKVHSSGTGSIEQLRKTLRQDQVVYGRVRSVRSSNKHLSFATIKGVDELKGDTQNLEVVFSTLKMNGGKLPQDPGEVDQFVALHKKIRRGDWIVVTGHLELSDSELIQQATTVSGKANVANENPDEPRKAGDAGAKDGKQESKSFHATKLPLVVAPALQTIPLQFAEGAEYPLRNRHADQIVNPRCMDAVYFRSRILDKFRAWFKKHRFLEVTTPLLSAGAGGAVARPFNTTATEFKDVKLSLRIAPELFLKRMTIAGFPRVFEIGQAFRNEEFTISEFYAHLMPLSQLMQYTEDLFRHLICETHAFRAELKSLEPPLAERFRKSFRREKFIVAVYQGVRKTIPDWEFPQIEADKAQDIVKSLEADFRQLGIAVPQPATVPSMIAALGEEFVESKCKEPTFIVEIPECLAPLAKSQTISFGAESSQRQFRVSARAELFIDRQEYANMYEEENSPFEQARKLDDQAIYAWQGDLNDCPKVRDDSFVRALEWGMPPTGGWGMGIDRLIMLLSGKKRIADVLPFGTLRNVVTIGSQGGHGAEPPPDSKQGALSQRISARMDHLFNPNKGPPIRKVKNRKDDPKERDREPLNFAAAMQSYAGGTTLQSESPHSLEAEELDVETVNDSQTDPDFPFDEAASPLDAADVADSTDIQVEDLMERLSEQSAEQGNVNANKKS